MGPHQEMAPRSLQRRFSPGSGNSLAQGRSGCRGGLDAIARMACVHRACALPVAAAWRVDEPELESDTAADEGRKKKGRRIGGCRWRRVCDMSSNLVDGWWVMQRWMARIKEQGCAEREQEVDH